MWNPLPGPLRTGVRCPEYPHLSVYEPVVGDHNDHAHINPYGITFGCSAPTEESDA